MTKSLLIIILFVSGVFIACTKGGNQKTVNGNVYTVNAQLNGKKVFPALAADTSGGTVTGLYDEEMNSLSFRFTYVKDTSVIKLDTLRMIRLFKSSAAAADTASAARRLLISTNISASSKTNITGAFNFGLSGNNGLTAEEQQGFISGSFYFILYSSRFPNGLIGGQLVLTRNP